MFSTDTATGLIHSTIPSGYAHSHPIRCLRLLISSHSVILVSVVVFCIDMMIFLLPHSPVLLWYVLSAINEFPLPALHTFPFTRLQWWWWWWQSQRWRWRELAPIKRKKRKKKNSNEIWHQNELYMYKQHATLEIQPAKNEESLQNERNEPVEICEIYFAGIDIYIYVQILQFQCKFSVAKVVFRRIESTTSALFISTLNDRDIHKHKHIQVPPKS